MITAEEARQEINNTLGIRDELNDIELRIRRECLKGKYVLKYFTGRPNSSKLLDCLKSSGFGVSIQQETGAEFLLIDWIKQKE